MHDEAKDHIISGELLRSSAYFDTELIITVRANGGMPIDALADLQKFPTKY